MIETKITCDGCDKEINPTTDYMGEWYLELRSVSKTARSSFSYATQNGNPITAKQFCTLSCIDKYCRRDS